MAQNLNLHEAKKAAQDEFYTQLSDINAEVINYREHFRDKVVYCNCDDPRVSNFFIHFSRKFKEYGLQKLIATCYKNPTADEYSKNNSEQSVYLEYDGTQGGLGTVHPLHGDSEYPGGDFRSERCIEFLEQADIVVTNPPFSLFREYVQQLVEYDKKFLIIGNQNAINFKEIFPLIKGNRIWLGPSISSGDREFGVPDHYPLTASSFRVDDQGKKFVRVKGVRWFTNLDHQKRYEDFEAIDTYFPQKYPHYDNYDAIEVSETKLIPKNWKGAMGVPGTFMDKESLINVRTTLVYYGIPHQ